MIALRKWSLKSRSSKSESIVSHKGFFPVFWKLNTGSRDAVGNKLFKAVRSES